MSDIFTVCKYHCDNIANVLLVVNVIATRYPHAVTVRELIGQRIKALREKQGLSLSELARRCESQRQTVHVWEQGRAKPVDEVMLAVARALGTSISYLYGETDDPRPAPDWHSGAGPDSEAEARVSEAKRFLVLALEQLSNQTKTKDGPPMPKLNTARLKQALKDRDMELPYFAARVDQHAPPVSDAKARAWLSGKLQPTENELIYISGCVGLSESELLSEDEAPAVRERPKDAH
ncbi:helix-turn-helix transcriptional regulator [bacterium]|nr:helix-turn-helix transcriptional regulator [bacterium]